MSPRKTKREDKPAYMTVHRKRALIGMTMWQKRQIELEESERTGKPVKLDKRKIAHFNMKKLVRLLNLKPHEKEIAESMRKQGFVADEIRTFIQIERAKEREAKQVARAKEFIEMRLEREMSFQAIALEKGISRERVRQILLRIEKDYGVVFPKIIGKTRETPDVATRCGVCQSIVEVPGRKYKENKIYFCQEHKGTRVESIKYVRLCPNWNKMSSRERQNWKYHNDPEYKERHITAVRKYTQRVNKTPEVRKRMYDYTKIWRARKLAENPDYFKEQEQRRKERKAARIAELRQRMAVIHSGDNIPSMNQTKTGV